MQNNKRFSECLAQAAAIVAAYRGEAPTNFDPRAEGEPDLTAAAVQMEKTRAALLRMTASLNAMNLHDALKPHVKAMTDEVNGLLTRLPPLERHKAAGSAVGALDSLTYAMNSMTDALEHAHGTVATISKNCNDLLGAKDASVNGLVDTGVKAGLADEIKKKVAAGELFEKAAVDGLVQAARTQGKDLALNGIQLAATRRQALTNLALPLPENEAVLEGDEAAFTALKTNAATRIEALKKSGLSLNSAPDLVRHLIYSSAFESELKNIASALKATGVKIEPLIGIGAESPKTSSGKRLVL